MNVLLRSRDERPPEDRTLRHPQARAGRPAGPGSQVKPGPEPSQAATKGPARLGWLCRLLSLRPGPHNTTSESFCSTVEIEGLMCMECISCAVDDSERVYFG